MVTASAQRSEQRVSDQLQLAVISHALERNNQTTRRESGESPIKFALFDVFVGVNFDSVLLHTVKFGWKLFG